MKYIYAYNGSGLPMACAVRVTATMSDGFSLVEFPAYEPSFDRLAERESVVGTNPRWVRSVNVIRDTTQPPPASFNFLD